MFVKEIIMFNKTRLKRQLNKKIGNMVEKGNILAYIHSDDRKKGETAVEDLLKIYTIE